ncbi:UDP-N-acetylglucosamine 2-epimerase (non-hydrolyzing) [Halorubrum salinarum]|uniref:UDP-N-acetylglucosamine 2-epimerase (Non-hydrolyzing) n=1 Tax=Halorubrum salinarum TaxID=2739057 RepID=A0A7D4BVZ2_9EURY|nr:UDP-N-acetylglucosamine 2-epimerase (non-hydrolyzing) [Halorubrum salinarum]QKG92035.1 UDP-N-acetylglucosamine 2-epimerase (non-hydrolyzing) [Halorubrum salinarum]
MSTEPEIVFVVGTRPEIIKTAPVLRAVRDSDALDVHVVHTDQHYDDNMSAAFFEVLNLGMPDEHLGVGSGTQGEQTAKGLMKIERLLGDRSPAAVLAQGDTNAVLSTALSASKLPVDFGHIESGIRSYDRSMPEETNRVLADHVAELNFAPTDVAVENLADEGIEDGVHATGNTVVDACLQHRSFAESESTILDDFGLTAGKFVAVTIHRPVNTDDPDRLTTILEAFDGQAFPVVFPCHPRTRTAIDDLGFEPTGSLRLVEPLDYIDFLNLQANARLVVTDSGGIQEEASILQVPCLTVRPNTERPETVDAGVNKLIPPAALNAEIRKLFGDSEAHEAMRGAPDLYGEGNSGARIADILERRYGA